MIKIIKNISGLTDSKCWQKTSWPFCTFRRRITIPLTSWENDLFLYYQQKKIRFITNYLTTLFKWCLNLYSSNAHLITTQWHKSIILTLNSSPLLHLSLTQIHEVDDDEFTSRDDICLPKAATSPHLSDHCLLSADMYEINITRLYCS